MFLPLDTTSFQIDANSTHFQPDAPVHQYIPVVAFTILQFFGNFGVSAIPNMMMCEVFSFKLVFCCVSFIIFH